MIWNEVSRRKYQVFWVKIVYHRLEEVSLHQLGIQEMCGICFDCLWTLRFDVDVLGIETGLSADDIEDRGGDNVERTDVVNFSPGRSNFPPNFFRSRKLRNFGSDILSTGKSESN